MKFRKTVDTDKQNDIYTLYIPRREADAAFSAMSDHEKRFIAALQETTSIADRVKILEIWARKIEEVKSGKDTPENPVYG
jgi:hypothetical protein